MLKSVAVLCVVFAARAALAVVPATEVYLPSVGHAQGRCLAGHCSQWRSDVWVFNPGAVPASVTVSFLRRDAANLSPRRRSISVGPGETVELDDVVLSLFGVTGAYGALRFGSDVPVAVTGRVYDENVSTGKGIGTAGQLFAGLPAAAALASGGVADLISLAQDDGGAWRSSFGFVETSGNAATVEATLLSAMGEELASKSYSVKPFEARQLALTDLCGPPGGNRRLRFEVTGGAGRVLPFGSRVDNRSGDAFTVTALTPALASYLPSVGHAQGHCPEGVCSQWRTDAWVFNPGASAAAVTVSFLRRDAANLVPLQRDVTVAAGETLELDDVVLSLFGLDASYGALRLVSDLPVAVAGRIYDENVHTDRGTGTAGQLFAGLPADGAVAPGAVADLIGMAQDTGGLWRSNFGLVETAGGSATVLVQQLASDGTVEAAKVCTLRAYEAWQDAMPVLGGPLGENKRVRVRFVAGTGRVLAFGSRIDNRTGDPFTVEATTSASNALDETVESAEAPPPTPHRRLPRSGVAPRITTSSLPGATAGESYGPLTLHAFGGTPPYAWAIVAGTEPTPGFLDATTGVLTGLISVSGYFPMEIEVTDSLGLKGRRALTLAVVAPPSFSAAGSATVAPGEHWYGDFTVTSTGAVTVSAAGGGAALAAAQPTVLNVTGKLTIEAGGSLVVPDCSELRINLLSRTQLPEIDGELRNTCPAPGSAGGDLIVRTVGSLSLGGEGARATLASSGALFVGDPWYRPRAGTERLQYTVTDETPSVPPVCAVMADVLEFGNPPAFPVDVTVTAIHQDPDGGATSIALVDWGDGSVVSDPAALAHSYAAGGVFEVVVTVRDDEGEESQASLTLSLQPETDPGAPPGAGDTHGLPSLWAGVDPFAAAGLVVPVDGAFHLTSRRSPASAPASFESDEWSFTCPADTEVCATNRSFSAPGAHTILLVGSSTAGETALARMTVWVPLKGGAQNTADPPAPAAPFPPLPPSYAAAASVQALSHGTECSDCALCDGPFSTAAPIVVLGNTDLTSWTQNGLVVVGFQGATVVIRPTYAFLGTAGASGGPGANGKSGIGFGVATAGGRIVACGGTFTGARGGDGGDNVGAVGCNRTVRGGNGAPWFGVLFTAPAGSLSFCSAPPGLSPNRGPITVIGADGGDGGDADVTGSGVAACSQGCGATAIAGRGGLGGGGIAYTAGSVCYDASYQIVFQASATGAAVGGDGGVATATGSTPPFCPACDTYAGTGGYARAYGGRGGRSTWYFLTKPSQAPSAAQLAEHFPPASGVYTGGAGGDADAEAGGGGNALCIGCNQTAIGGNGGRAYAEGGKGGFGLSSSGAGGDADATARAGGDADATGLDGGPCAPGCAIAAVGGRADTASAWFGKRGGFGAADGTATSTAERGGDGSATGGVGGTCPDCPGGRGGDGGKAVAWGGNGGNAFGNGARTAANGGDGDATGGNGGDGANCCRKFADQPGGNGGKGGDAWSVAGAPGQPGGAFGANRTKAGKGGDGGDGEDPGTGGAKGIGTGIPVDIPDGVKGLDGDHCPLPLVLLIYHSTIPDGTITPGSDILLDVYLQDKTTKVGTVVAHFKTQNEFGGNPVNYVKHADDVYLLGGIRWHLQSLTGYPIAGAQATIWHNCRDVGCARLLGFSLGQQVAEAQSQLTPPAGVEEILTLPPPPGTSVYDETGVVCYTTCRFDHWAIVIIDP